MANKILNIDSILDDEDRGTLFKYAFPYEYIRKKYGDIFESRKEEEVINILKKEGFVKHAYSYCENDGGVGGTVETVYGTTFGSTIGGGKYDPTHFDFMRRIYTHFDRAGEWFKDYIKRKTDKSTNNGK